MKATKAKLEKPVEEAPAPERVTDPKLQDKARNYVFRQMGGIPKNYHKAAIIPIGAAEKPVAFRVNIYTQEEGDNFVMINKIVHSQWVPLSEIQ